MTILLEFLFCRIYTNRFRTKSVPHIISSLHPVRWKRVLFYEMIL